MGLTARRLRRATLLAGLLVGLAVLFAAPAVGAGGGGETLDVTIPPTGRVSCVDDGQRLGADPTLHTGDHATCTVTGLDPKERVTVTVDAHGRDLGPLTTDAKGGLTFRFTVPSGLSIGAHRLAFAGQKSRATAVQAFRLAAKGNPGKGGGAHRGGPGPGSLVFTGAYVIGPLIAAAALIAAGTTLTVANRRRRRLG
ncbi:MAG TPA: hypothetical protein VFW65_36435 [Pseudonocardiaceae bacterium]|nr:hypothetical protein [Pseudonocardiaceae bacterium]